MKKLVIGRLYKEYAESGTTAKIFTDYRLKHVKERRLNAFFNDWMYTTSYTKYITHHTTIDNIVAVYSK